MAMEDVFFESNLIVITLQDFHQTMASKMEDDNFEEPQVTSPDSEEMEISSPEHVSDDIFEPTTNSTFKRPSSTSNYPHITLPQDIELQDMRA